MLGIALECIPAIAVALACMLVFTVCFTDALRKHAAIFYVIATASCVAMYWYSPWEWAEMATGAAMPAAMEAYETGLYAFLEAQPTVNLLVEALFSVHTGIALYIIVMFIGALPKTPVVKRLFTVRSEMSILGGIYVAGHAFMRIGTVIYYFTDDISQASLPAWLEIANIVLYGVGMLALLLVFLVPWITSFPAVRRKMQPSRWKRVQRATAYPFFAIMVVLGMFVGIDYICSGIAQFAEGEWVVSGDVSTFPAWMIAGSGMVWIYAITDITYLALRLGKARRDKDRKGQAAA